MTGHIQRCVRLSNNLKAAGSTDIHPDKTLLNIRGNGDFYWTYVVSTTHYLFLLDICRKMINSMQSSRRVLITDTVQLYNYKHNRGVSKVCHHFIE